MLERSALAENALQCLHDEAYDRPFDTRTLSHEQWLFTGGRSAVSLSGPWRFCVDPCDTGLRQRWYLMEPSRPEDRTEPWDYDPHDGDTIPIPSNWQMVREKWFYYEGSVWYSRTIDTADLPPGNHSPGNHSPGNHSKTDRRFLRIGAAAYDCKVFLNGAFLGNHRGASTPFVVELTSHLQPGENTLMLCVNNTRSLDRVPMRNTDWFNYGGVYRDVEIFSTPADVVRDLFVHLVPDGTFSKISVAAQLEGTTTSARFEIPELDIAATLTPDANGWAEATIDARPALWSPASPRLYDVHLSYGDDRVTDRIGFREIKRQGTLIHLNGAPLFLRGISVHEDDIDHGKCTSAEDLARRFDHAAELNCNFVRLAHYPHHEDAARMADERGFLLWEEIPVYWAIAFDDPLTLADARNQLLELIRRDRNRASVILWSVGNENPDTDDRLAFMTDLVDTARRADPTRLITAACLVNHARLEIEDRLASRIDVIGLNEYYGWYEEDFGDLVRIGENSRPDRPVIISETGADGVPVPDGPESGLFSESYMADVYRRQIDILGRLPYISGMSPWILYDFRAERRQNIFQRGWNRKGLIAQDKSTRKAAFGILAGYYADLAKKDRATP